MSIDSSVPPVQDPSIRRVAGMDGPVSPARWFAEDVRPLTVDGRKIHRFGRGFVPRGSALLPVIA